MVDSYPARGCAMMEPDQGWDRPFCFSCGYDLTGLSLPRPCPECGQLADPERQTEEARRWFASRRSWLWLFTRASKIPPAVLYALDDPTSVHLARRRMFIGIILPALLCTFIVFVGSTIGVKKRYKEWYYDPNDPDRTPRRVSIDTEVDRLYSFNLHFDLFGFRPPPSWVKESELLPGQSFTLNWPSRYFLIDPVTLIHFGPPWVILLFGYLPCRFILLGLGKRASPGKTGPRTSTSLKSGLVLPCAGLAVQNWSWVGAVVISGISDLVPISTASSYAIDDVLGYALITLVGVGVVNAVFAWPHFIRLEKAGRLFSFRASSAMLLVFVNLAGPVGFAFLVIWVESKL